MENGLFHGSSARTLERVDDENPFEAFDTELMALLLLNVLQSIDFCRESFLNQLINSVSFQKKKTFACCEMKKRV